MDRYINESISLLDQVKIQAQVLVPLLRALRAELGVARAEALVFSALRSWSKDLFESLAAAKSGTPGEKWMALTIDNLPRIGDDIAYTTTKQDGETLEFDVTRCHYAEFFRALNEPELGAILLCESDFHMAETTAGAVNLQRTQTLMQGATHCDFRYRMKLAPTTPEE